MQCKGGPPLGRQLVGPLLPAVYRDGVRVLPLYPVCEIMVTLRDEKGFFLATLLRGSMTDKRAQSVMPMAGGA